MARRRRTIGHDTPDGVEDATGTPPVSGDQPAPESGVSTSVELPLVVERETAFKPGEVPSDRESRALAVVDRFTGWSTGAGLLPVPGLDFTVIIGIHVKMLGSIAAIYGVPFRANLVRPLIVALLSGGGSYLLAAPAASLMKLLPFVGSIAGMLTMPALSAASCHATGKVFIQHFESGGTFLDFEPTRVREHYTRLFRDANTRTKR
jgi:uncharacterized protein (DUF697 family)